jgi:cytidine deaminase
LVRAAFALGNAITKACPPGFVRLDADPDLCKMAATAANRTYVGSVAYSYYPFGCYWHTFTNKVYLNGYTGTIEAETYAQPLCAGTASARWLVHAVTRTDAHANLVPALAHERSNTHADSSSTLAGA